MFDRNLTMRIDDSTNEILKILVNDLNFSKAEVVRKSLRTFNQLREFQKKYGELKIITSKGEQLLVLIS